MAYGDIHIPFMGDDERDAIMAAFFKSEAEDRAEQKRIQNAKDEAAAKKQPEPLEPEDVDHSPLMVALRAKVLTLKAHPANAKLALMRPCPALKLPEHSISGAKSSPLTTAAASIVQEDIHDTPALHQGLDGTPKTTAVEVGPHQVQEAIRDVAATADGLANLLPLAPSTDIEVEPLAKTPAMPTLKHEVPATGLSAVAPVTLAPAPEAAKCALSDFPIAALSEVKEVEDPLRAMTELCARLISHKDYALERDEYCNLSIRLNLIGKLAPAYRPEVAIGATFGKAIGMVRHRDNTVIDLHWCHATKMSLMPNSPEMVALFSEGSEFHFKNAWEPTGKKITSKYKASEALCLTPFQQCQLKALIGSDHKAAATVMRSGWFASGGKEVSKVASVKRQLGQWAERDKQVIARRDCYLKLWLAREMLGRDASNQLIGELLALMLGSDVLDRTSVRDKLRTLDKHVKLL
jgi:hypothetical protein